MSIKQKNAAKNEREQFEEWNRGQVKFGLTPEAAAWEAWKARALIEYPDCLDCEECEGNGVINHNYLNDPQWDVPCPVCKGELVASWV